MSLREKLKQAVASCAPIETQLATFAANDATASATNAQQHPANPHGITIPSATASATPAQLVPATSATFTPSEVAPVALVASALTAERVMRKLLDAAMRACDHREDDEAAREQMRAEALGDDLDRIVGTLFAFAL